MSKPKRFTEHPVIQRLAKGPKLPYLEDVKRFRVKYRTRPWDSDDPTWTVSQIEMVCPNEDVARYRTIQQVRQKAEVEVLRVEEVAAEQAIQTGRHLTKVVSDKEYQSARENEKAASEYERKKALEALGLWLPPS